MKHLFTKLICVVLVLFTVTSSAQNLTAEFDAIVADYYNKNMPGMTLLVAKNGKPIYTKAIGKANLELDVDMTLDNVFILASISKQFTAIATLMLQEQGKLNLNDDLTKYIPDYPTNGKTITIHHLLNHTSGIKSYTGIGNLKELAHKNLSLTKLIDYFKNEPMDFNPGEEYSYNNSGYILLGYIIEKVSGSTYEDFIEQQIFKKLGMTNSRFGSNSEIIKRRASGYEASQNAYKNADFIYPSIAHAAGGLMSTVEDMLKWQNALANNTLISQNTMEKAINGSTLNDGSHSTYGYGLGETNLKGSKGYTHSGGIFGFSTDGIYLINEDVYVIGLSNCSCNDIGAVVRKAAAVAIGKPYPNKKDAITLSNTELQKWVGVYKFKDDVFRHITLEKNMLFSQRVGSVKLPIYAMSNSHFIFEDGTTSYYFSTDKNGKRQVKMVTNEETIGTETQDAPPAEKASIKVSEDILKTYEGKYELQPGFIITIEAKGNELFAKATGQGQFEIFAESETKFFAKIAGIEIVFNKYATGAIEKLTLYQGGAVMPAKKIE